ncbi:hypothetical protein [Duganella aceris]|jgi:hypothetical protein|uniref:hypothetical protein n=1 Tax=Duganella aceris TaxID=2703883 RepID=UPI0014087351|nr:hypothetical protein [Duganella aceris]
MNLDSNNKHGSYAMRMFKDSLRRYFAPLTGAVRGSIRAVKAEMRRADRERERSKR